MNAPVTATPIAVVFLLLRLIGSGEEFGTAVYLQGHVPAASVQVQAVNEGDRIYYDIAIESVDESGTVELIAEPSDLVAHTFLLYMDDAPTGVVSTAPLLAALGSVNGEAVQSFEVEDGADLGVGASLHLVRLEAGVLLTAPDAGIAILTLEE